MKALRRLFPLITIVVLVLLAVLVAIGSAIWDDYGNKIVENLKQQMLNESEITANQMSLAMSGYLNEFDVITSMADSADADGYFSNLVHSDNGLSRDVTVMDQDGTVVYSVSNPVYTTYIKASDVSSRVSIYFAEDEAGSHYFVFQKTLDDGRTVRYAIDEDTYYEDVLAKVKIGRNGYLILKNSSGLILMHKNKDQWGIDVIEGRREMYPDLDYSSLEAMVKKQDEGGSGVLTYDSYWWTSKDKTKVKKISAYAEVPLGDDFWVVSSVVDYSDFVGPVNEGFREVSALFSIATLLALFLIFLISALIVDKRRVQSQNDSLRKINDRLEYLHTEEEKMAHQQQLQVIGTMTGGIAHEFNNILTPIMGYSEMLMMELPKESEAYSEASEIYDASEKAGDIVRQISALSRKNMETVFKQLALQSILERSYKMMTSICPANVRLTKEFQVSDAQILGNKTQFNQVMLNLFINAVHAIGKADGTVVYRAELMAREDAGKIPQAKKLLASGEWETYVHISLTDSGCGMTKETMSQIFLPFFTTKKAGEGTGLGLALAERYITEHKGIIYAESEPGKGSVFHILLPIMEKQEMLESLEHDIETVRRVLVADDNQKVLHMLENNMKKVHIEVVSCDTREKLMEALKDGTCDMLLIDEEFDNHSAVDICMQARGLQPDMLSFVMVDYVNEAVLEAEDRHLISGYLLKPVSVAAILGKYKILNSLKAQS